MIGEFIPFSHFLRQHWTGDEIYSTSNRPDIKLGHFILGDATTELLTLLIIHHRPKDIIYLKNMFHFWRAKNSLYY